MGGSMKTITTTAAALALLAGLALAGTADHQAATDSRAQYCEMVALWHADSHLPPEQRAGWPPYDGECK